ncbi:MAG: hypothetical protein DHS20C18_37910 [Saprospiraceae bacterium]|nr:MAG: hypothetical protein DHS20C18_37910 [Saprospiraceae bacterium]
MARKIKVDNSVLKRLNRQEKREKIEFKKKRKFILIVCEGEKTEPNYFESKKRGLPANVLETVEIDIHGTGKNTLKVVKAAESEVEKANRIRNKVFDSVWIVIDRDSFPAQDFNNAIFKCTGKGFKCAWTNEAFELWYVLHFQYRNTEMSREDHKKVIEEEVNKKINQSGKGLSIRSFEYKKNDPNMYFILEEYGDEDMAIQHAEKLCQLYTNQQYAKHNPCTKVHELVKEINMLT